MTIQFTARYLNVRLAYSDCIFFASLFNLAPSSAVLHQSLLGIASNMQVRISLDFEISESAGGRLVRIPVDELQVDTTTQWF